MASYRNAMVGLLRRGGPGRTPGFRGRGTGAASWRGASAVAAALVGALLSSTRPAHLAGQTGPWAEVVVGAGALHFTCDLCAADRDVAASVHFAAGAYAAPNLGVGMEAGWWSHDDAGIRERVYRVGLVSHLHPREGSGLHLAGGLGWVGYRAGDFNYDAVSLSAGAGWDLPLAGRWVVGNRVTLDAASFGTLRNGDRRVATEVSLSLVRFTVFLKRR